MASFGSYLTRMFRRVAGVLPQSNPLRQKASAIWDRVLSLGGKHTDVPVCGRTIRLQIPFRRLDPNYERESVDLWIRLLSAGDVVWDVGSNFGLYAVLSGFSVGPTGRVVSWEPSPLASEVAADHLVANGLNGWSCVRQAAVADQSGVLPFSVTEAASYNPMNRLGANKMGTTINVPVETLDHVLRSGEPPPTAVKIDVEGAEVLALRGASLLFVAGGPRPIVLLAVHPTFLPEFGCRPEELTEFFTRNEYTCFETNGTLSSPTQYAEYLMVPSERRDAITRKLQWG
jgi:FkbM family methyltransferase